MNQPKFKFGDKVKSGSGDVFIVSDVRRDAECDYIYNGDRCSGPHYAEFDLELYQEPQKKKLYAYRLRGKTEFKFDLVNDEFLHPGYSLAPEYDIEYPEASV